MANSAVSAQVKSELTQADEASFDKPQILQPTADSRTIISHTIVGGESLDAIAAQYAVAKDTIKWANNLTADTAEEGKVLLILPIDGVLYTVKAGDTVVAIADKYKVDQTRIVLYNDLDVAGLTAGAKIILPGGALPTEERPGYVAPRQFTATTSFSYGNYNGDVKYLYAVGFGASSPGNTGTPGQCTWYAWDRRTKLGQRMPSGAVLGNASDWAYTLGARGYNVGRGNPSVGAIMQNGGGAGHVAIVESISENGDVTVTEMNYAWRAFQVTQRTISAGQAALYTFIQ